MQPPQQQQPPPTTQRVTIDQAMAIALSHHRAGRFHEADAIYRQVLAAQPQHHDAMQLLGAAACQRGDHAAGIELISRAIAMSPNIAHYHGNLGTALWATGRKEEAAAALRRALALDDKQFDPHVHLGDFSLERGDLGAAAQHYRAALRLRPDAHVVHNNLGHVLLAQGHAEQVATSFREAFRIRPDFVQPRANLATVLVQTGQIDDAIEQYRATLKLAPNLAIVHSSLLYALHFDERATPRQIFDEHLNWNRLHAEPLKAQHRPHENARDPERRLRVGYVSQDFRDHPVARFMLPLLAGQDRERFEVHVLSDVFREDDITQQARTHADRWHETKGLGDDAVAEMVRREQIDILVDLCGHVGVSRLLVFARKPAPVQVTYLGYPDTTGMTAMDYRLTDAEADPVGQTERLHTEQLARLAGGFLCYRPPADVPDVSPRPPSASDGHVTFGSFNNLAKISPGVMAAWARILKSVPKSRLLIKSRSLEDEATRRRVRRAMAGHGIDSRRLDIRGREPSHATHLALYREIDVALDTFPYNGATTTCEALIMGVPVVALAGQAHAGRVGMSILTHLGRPRWIAGDVEDYVRIATSLAKDPQELATQRVELRPTLLSSPLGDAARFCREFDDALRAMWRRWCAV